MQVQEAQDYNWLGLYNCYTVRGYADEYTKYLDDDADLPDPDICIGILLTDRV